MMYACQGCFIYDVCQCLSVGQSVCVKDCKNIGTQQSDQHKKKKKKSIRRRRRKKEVDHGNKEVHSYVVNA